MADITTPVTEVESSAAQTAATAELGKDKGKVRKFTFSKEKRHLLLQAVQKHDENRAPHKKKERCFRISL